MVAIRGILLFQLHPNVAREYVCVCVCVCARACVRVCVCRFGSQVAKHEYMTKAALRLFQASFI